MFFDDDTYPEPPGELPAGWNPGDWLPPEPRPGELPPGLLGLTGLARPAVNGGDGSSYFSGNPIGDDVSQQAFRVPFGTNLSGGGDRRRNSGELPPGGDAGIDIEKGSAPGPAANRPSPAGTRTSDAPADNSSRPSSANSGTPAPKPERVPDSDNRVKEWLDKAHASGLDPLVYLQNARQQGLDRYDDNLAAAERYTEALQGVYGNGIMEAPIILGDGIVKKIGQGAERLAKERGIPLNLHFGSKDDKLFVTRWGLHGALHNITGGSYKDVK